MTALWRMTIVSAPTPQVKPSSIDAIRYHEYKVACVQDSLTWAQAPFCPELLYYQPGVLDPARSEHRRVYAQAVGAWETFIAVKQLPIQHVVYLDMIREMDPEQAQAAIETKLDPRFRLDRKLPPPELQRLQGRWASEAWQRYAKFKANTKNPP